MSGLYIHIPFCERKCDYCAFYSFSRPWKNEENFFQGLEKEMKNLETDFFPTTIFIGGGTPNTVSTVQLKKMFGFIAESLELSNVNEFSFEMNPGIIDSGKLAALRAGRVNRLSIGVQSFDSDCLKTLGRIHSAEEAEGAFRLARTAGFENISLDLMFGVPGQTMEMLECDLNRALALKPQHISIYNLMVEVGTPLADLDPVRLDEALEREMYDLIRARLADAGFGHYEISNFAKPGFECRHNLLYWNGGEYMGCGPAAHSHWKGTRWANVSDLDDYSANGPRREFEETIGPEAKARETLVMGLRLLKGADVPLGLWAKLETPLRRLEAAGLIVIEGRKVRLSEEALFVSDAVFAELV